jgi:hypothetical protein
MMTPMMTLEEQIAALAQLIDDWALKQSRQVRGAFTSGEYVEYQLRTILGPHAWSFTILQGPELVTISESEAYAQVVGRLQARFADGSEVHQDAVGVWPLRASNVRDGGTLEGTSAERYEAVLKAACTDALKAAAERLGSCFRPLTDLELQHHIQREASARSEPEPLPQEVSVARDGATPVEPAPIPAAGAPAVEAPEGLTDSTEASAGEATAADYWKLASEAFKTGVSPERIREIYDGADGVSWSQAIGQLRKDMGE